MTAQQDEKESSSTLQLEFGWPASMSRNKCIIFVSYICIVTFHLGTIDVPCEGCDVEAEPEDGEWWTRLEDGQMDPDVHDRRKMLAEQLSFN
jgi:hypothetical protein